MTKPRLLDLYCGAGLAAQGYIDAGFDVTGIDIEPQPRFPGPFIQMDVLKLDLRFIRSFDAIHASPPCQAHTALRSAPGAKAHPSLISPTRELLRAAGVPYVIENVPGAPLLEPVVLCGSMFGLGADGHQLRRHRLFEASFALPKLRCAHRQPVIGIYGGHVRNRAAKHGGRGTADFPGANKKGLALDAMGLTDRELTMDEISQGIPPAFTKWLGEQLLAHLAGRAAA
ncbi:MAG: DNA cytosine methyltransferase [Caulobacterales bacterium]|nr:DNA cytosine methyltransferase [Caulobacterales bacterium]